MRGILQFYNDEAYKIVKTQLGKMTREQYTNYYQAFDSHVKPYLAECAPLIKQSSTTSGSGTYGSIVKCSNEICKKQIKTKKQSSDPVEIILEAFIQSLVYCLNNHATVPALICKEGPNKYSLVTTILTSGLADFVHDFADGKEVIYAMFQIADHLHKINQAAMKHNMLFTHRDLNMKNIMYVRSPTLLKFDINVDNERVEFYSHYVWKIIDFGMSCIKHQSFTTFTTGYRNYYQSEGIECKPHRDLTILLYDMVLRRSRYRKFRILFNSIRHRFFPLRQSSGFDLFEKSVKNDMEIFERKKTGKYSNWQYENYHPITPRSVITWGTELLRNPRQRF